MFSVTSSMLRCRHMHRRMLLCCDAQVLLNFLPCTAQRYGTVDMSRLDLRLLQDGLFMIAFDKPWAAVEWAVTLQLAMLK